MSLARTPFRENTKFHHWLLFSVVVILYLCWLVPQGSMLASSRDAAETWHSITTWYSGERYGAYTLYKGFSAIYPYVWLYQLALLCHVNEFFFCMLYHALLFSFVVTIGIPQVTEYLLDYRPRFWQRVVLIVFFSLIWKPTFVLSELMVDLPSCAFFLASLLCVCAIPRSYGGKQLLMFALAGLFSGLCANISGQYSVSAACVLVAALFQLRKCRDAKKSRKLLAILLLFACCGAVKLLNACFMSTAIAPLVADGAWIPSSEDWMHRALVYFIDKNRYLFGTPLMNPRGMAILQDIYGEDGAAAIMESAAAGAFGWTIPDYFSMVFRYPVDAVVQAMDKFFLSFSVDMCRRSAVFLISGYTLFYLAILAAVKRVKQWNDLLSDKTFVVIGALSALIPAMVMTLEPRTAVGGQSVIFGVALLGDSLGSGVSSVLCTLSRGKLGQRAESVNPWVFILWFVFILLCMMHMGAIYAQSDMGTEMLFKLW